jgi:hypothetical protein
VLRGASLDEGAQGVVKTYGFWNSETSELEQFCRHVTETLADAAAAGFAPVPAEEETVVASGEATPAKKKKGGNNKKKGKAAATAEEPASEGSAPRDTPTKASKTPDAGVAKGGMASPPEGAETGDGSSRATLDREAFKVALISMLDDDSFLDQLHSAYTAATSSKKSPRRRRRGQERASE